MGSEGFGVGRFSADYLTDAERRIPERTRLCRRPIELPRPRLT